MLRGINLRLLSKIKFNKKHLIIALSILIVLIIAIVIVVLVINKQEKEDEINNELEIGNFETQIDMTNLENSQIREDGMKINTSSKIAEGIEFNDLLIKDITIESSGDMAVFNASVENNLGKDKRSKQNINIIRDIFKAHNPSSFWSHIYRVALFQSK